MTTPHSQHKAHRKHHSAHPAITTIAAQCESAPIEHRELTAYPCGADDASVCNWNAIENFALAMNRISPHLPSLLLILCLVTACGKSEKTPVTEQSGIADASQSTPIALAPFTGEWWDIVPSSIDERPTYIAKLQAEAERGTADAQRRLGDIYQTGELAPPTGDRFDELVAKYVKDAFLPKDPAKAAEWYSKAADQGNASAQTDLGFMLLYGEGIPKDEKAGHLWLEKAAGQGDAKAQNLLGIAHLYGHGVKKDPSAAFPLFLKAADANDAGAQINLAGLYYDGTGTSKNLAAAAQWFQRAAESGVALAQVRLAYMLYHGEGTPKNFAKAFPWYLRAAKSGHGIAQANTGIMLRDGDGVSEDKVLAYAWLNLAAAANVSGAAHARQQLERELSPAEIQEAQRLSAAWKPGQDISREAAIPTPTATASGVQFSSLKKVGSGTAFFINKQGHAVTNRHVVAGCKALRIEGEDAALTSIVEDAANDLAVLKFAGKVKNVATLASNPQQVRQGEEVIVFGFPLNSLLSSGGNLTPGIVSATSGLGNNSSQMQITAPIQPGSSGSPVLNKKTSVVGVVVMKLSDAHMAKMTGGIAQNVNFAVSGQTLKAFLDAHQIEYQTDGLFSLSKSNEAIADEARRWTKVVECWK